MSTRDEAVAVARTPRGLRVPARGTTGHAVTMVQGTGLGPTTAATTCIR
jgi:hypothetical protein